MGFMSSEVFCQTIDGFKVDLRNQSGFSRQENLIDLLDVTEMKCNF